MSTKPDFRFAHIRASVASEMFAFAPDHVLELAPGATRWPDSLRGLLFNGHTADLLETRPTWCRRTIVIDPATFRSVPPPAPTSEPLLDEAAVCARLGLTAAAFQRLALSRGFPHNRSTRFAFNHETNSSTYAPLWVAREVDNWYAGIRALAPVAGQSL
ncbi:MAG: hypothetical protein DMF84_22110 [Acidobacteria bacterium]|nr:MAG: hypothetical protein DMF84_22110 [Acidobacteriota bacterium]